MYTEFKILFESCRSSINATFECISSARVNYPRCCIRLQFNLVTGKRIRAVPRPCGRAVRREACGAKHRAARRAKRRAARRTLSLYSG